MTIYLDNNATTPMETDVRELVSHYMNQEFGNAGSRTHEYGLIAKKAVETARRQIAGVVEASPDEVIFTSGATESNNLAILGLAEHLKEIGKDHIVTSSIEHKAVLEPIEHLEKQGFAVTYVQPSRNGSVAVEDMLDALREDTGLVSIMAVNNETGVIQPVSEIAVALSDTDLFLQVDAAQGFGKLLTPLVEPRIDLISVSGHKIYGPKGVGALIARRRDYKSPPIQPLMFGGGQEKGLRPGTLPVPLIAGLGLAAEIAVKKNKEWWIQCQTVKKQAIEAFDELGSLVHGRDEAMPNVINISIPGVDSEAAMVALKGIAAISNGSACTSSSYTPSHVLTAMGLSEDEIAGALRISWNHMKGKIPWSQISDALRILM